LNYSLSNLEVSSTLSDLKSIGISYFFGWDSNETTEEGGTSSLILYLESIPEGYFTMGLAVSDDKEAIISSENTLFFPSDLEKNHTIVPQRLDDEELDGDIDYELHIDLISSQRVHTIQMLILYLISPSHSGIEEV